MTIQSMKKPGGNDTDLQALEVETQDVPDVSGQIQRLSEAAEQAHRDKDTLRKEERQRQKEREERFRCCGIRI